MVDLYKNIIFSSMVNKGDFFQKGHHGPGMAENLWKKKIGFL